ncbi:uncharacterized protein L969DRAFT_92082 [Mixia osmundae IAM 14324]|uniref:Uncharacterized protein n=1 Tax=Mixia osmundae (strain CBS 9802 / IAM 14324 / JCM 22182 / KY 12970) TaxID=764103 RepID=G7DX78_MIXOS|nr:uncharacterized protein L969DRAFT_92082 [Mixia osmundae IAM 14324]KEI42649.1 hypothetical protein L969DRAFT_92082 [Mixia osmundae IAM 14324]GAA95188.1 hypothetical protein E5Q_01843 [Mixia osmundae IAM 14324]
MNSLSPRQKTWLAIGIVLIVPPALYAGDWLRQKAPPEKLARVIDTAGEDDEHAHERRTIQRTLASLRNERVLLERERANLEQKLQHVFARRMGKQERVDHDPRNAS